MSMRLFIWIIASGGYIVGLLTVSSYLSLTLSLTHNVHTGAVEDLHAAAALQGALSCSSSSRMTHALQATLGLLRICTRLLPYKESSAEALLKSLQLVLRLDPHVAWDLAQQIATELLKLVKSSAAYIRYKAVLMRTSATL